MLFVTDAEAAAYRRRVRGVSLAGLLGASVLALSCGSALAQAVTPLAPVAPTQAPETELREGVAAIVNNGIISTYDLRQRMLLLIISSGVRPTNESLPGLQREALTGLIDETLQMQEISRLEAERGVELQPTQAEIDEEISALASQNNLSGQQLLASLAQAGVDAETLRAQIRTQTSWQRYVGGAFSGRIAIGENEIDSALQRVSVAAAKPQYLIAEIFVDAQRAGGQEAAVEGARQLAQQISGGAPFAGVARQFSSAATAAGGGDAGWVMSGDIPQPVEQALEQMRPGQLSEPIAAPGGAYIVLLREKRSGADSTLVDLKQAALRLSADAPEADQATARARLEALRAQITSCETFETQAGAAEGVVAGSLGETDINDLSPAFREVISNLQPGQVGGPVRSDAGLHLVALCGRRAAGTDIPTREDVRQRLVSQELAMIARRELRDLRNSANIENK
jgi:peptidyl-prolyl cis-trans isomerase SurA